MRELQNRIIVAVITALVGFVGAIAALVFLCLGLFFWLAMYVNAAWAAALTAIIILAAVALTIVIVRLVMRGPAPKVAPENASAGAGNADWTTLLGGVLGQEASQLAARHPIATVAGSLAAGFAIGFSPALREALRKAFLG